MENSIYTKKKYYLLFAIYFLAFGVIIALTTSLINYNIRYTDIEKQLTKRAESESDFKKEYMKEYVTHVEMILSALSQNELTKKYIETRSELDRKNLNNLFYSLMYANKDLMQLRFIGTDGFEKIRIDRDKKSPALLVIPPDELQNKADRYYFKESLQVMDNNFWHSNVDLNVEHGKIEVPLKPTFRVSTPLVFANQSHGILIANVMMDNLLDIISNSPNFLIYIIDKDGEVIINPDNSKSWSRYLENKPNIRDLFPAKSLEIISNSSLKTDNFYMFSFSSVFKNNEGMKLLMVPKPEIVGSLRMNNVITALLIAAIVLLVSVPLSWLASFIPSKLQSTLVDAYSEIKKYTNIIDRNIATSKTDKEGKIIDVSSKFLEITGYKRSDIIGKTHTVLRHPDTPEEHYKDMWTTITSGRIWTGEMQDIGKTGNIFWIQQVITPEINATGDIVAYTSVAQDITDKKIIEKMSITDRLTNLYNRHKLDEVLLTEIHRFTRYQSNFCALLMDIDFFKKVNDTYGHQTGDEVLVQVASIINENTRLTDVSGRWGGEEFLVIAVQTELENACLLAEKIRAKIEQATFPGIGKITISIGVAKYEFSETEAHFINRADDALYKAKETGRNKVVCAESDIK